MKSITPPCHCRHHRRRCHVWNRMGGGVDAHVFKIVGQEERHTWCAASPTHHAPMDDLSNHKHFLSHMLLTVDVHPHHCIIFPSCHPLPPLPCHHQAQATQYTPSCYTTMSSTIIIIIITHRNHHCGGFSAHHFHLFTHHFHPIHHPMMMTMMTLLMLTHQPCVWLHPLHAAWQWNTTGCPL